MDILGDLNDSQRRAAETTEGPVLLLAGAGSGKTKTLVHRFAHLVQTGVSPEQILAVTFTNKAAKEMRERTMHLLGNSSHLSYLCTFHSLAARLLRIEYQAANLLAGWTIYDTGDRSSLVRRLLREEDTKVKPNMIIGMIADWKCRGLTPTEAGAEALYPNQRLAARLYAAYETEKTKNNALDFDDLLLVLKNVLEQHADLRQKWQNRFRYIMIDEYQDTNSIQYQITRLLLGPHNNICAVGDDWQSIYSWRGADFRNILRFEKDFPGATVIKLERNYRSTQPILSAADKIIRANTERTDKTLWTDQKQGDKVIIQGLDNDFEEAAWVADRIDSLSATSDYSNTAILYRTNAQSYLFERTFTAHNIPYKLVGGLRFYDRAEIKDLLAFLHLLVNPEDTVSLERVVETIGTGIGEKSWRTFLDHRGDQPLLAALHHPPTSLTPRAKASFRDLGALFNSLQTIAASATPGELVTALVRQINYRDHLIAGYPEPEERLANVDNLIVEAGEYPDVQTFLTDLALASSADETAERAVSLMTIHSAKGLEFDNIFVVGLEEGLLPMTRDESKSAIEEERRLLYVAMTRARKRLFVTMAHRRNRNGKIEYQVASRFLSDLVPGLGSPALDFDPDADYS
jgi:DNA helicase-2/ATP-dependent DNA helicase PcrA